jgi:hypothetical protein
MDKFPKGKVPPDRRRLFILGTAMIWDCRRGYTNEVRRFHTVVNLGPEMTATQKIKIKKELGKSPILDFQ